MNARYRRAGVIVLSGFIGVVLLMQTYTSLTASNRFGVPVAAYPAEWGWPFLAYPMYKKSHHVGERINYDYSLYAALPTGRVHIDREDLGLHEFWLFYTAVARAMLRGEHETAAPHLSKYCVESGLKTVEFELDDMGYYLGESGLVKDTPQTVASMKVDCSA